MAAGDHDGPTPITPRGWAFLALGLVALTLAYTALYVRGAGHLEDFKTFLQAGRNVLQGRPLYDQNAYRLPFYNPPWVALPFIPLGFLPFHLAAGVLAAASTSIVFLIFRRYGAPLIHSLFALASPPMFAILIFGQIDLLVIGGLLLPAVFWPIAALSKPQAAGGLLFRLTRKHALRAIAVLGALIVLSLLLFGWWPLQLLGGASPVYHGWNLWYWVYPLPLAAGIVLLYAGYRREDDLLYLAASPFLMPYVAPQSLIGPWLALCARARTRVVLAVWLLTWAAFAYVAYLVL